MTERLPSGAVAELEKPRLAAVLLGGGSVEALVDAVWAHDMDPERLDEGDRQWIAEWCLAGLAEDEEAPAFAQVCAKFGTPPSVRLRVTDPVLAFTCDYEFASLLVIKGEKR